MQVYLLRLHPGSFPGKHYSQVEKVSKCTFSRAGEMARWLKAFSSCRGPRLCSQNLLSSSSRLPVTPAPGDLTSSSSLHSHPDPMHIPTQTQTENQKHSLEKKCSSFIYKLSNTFLPSLLRQRKTHHTPKHRKFSRARSF